MEKKIKPSLGISTSPQDFNLRSRAERTESSRPPTILVVDDEDHIRRLYEKELSEEGYQVRTATTGEEAVRLAESQPPDLVILDIKLEDQDGLEILGDLKRISQNTPIILNSAYSTYKSNFQSWLADAYVVE